MKYAIVFYLFLIFITQSFGQYQYPFANGGDQPYINGLIGEERCGANCSTNRTSKRCRYHLGLDMVKANGTSLYNAELQTEQVRNLAGAPALGHFGYVHASLDNGYSYGDNVPSRTWFAKVGSGHLHFEQHTTNLSTNMNVTSWEDAGFINPIFTFNPVDNATPRIDFAKIYKNDQTTELTSNSILYGKLDLLVNTEDEHITETGDGGGFSTSPLQIDFDIHLENNVILAHFDGIDFTNSPTNASALSVHGPGADCGVPNFEYWVTNDAFNTPYNKYLNLFQTSQSTYNVSSQCPSECMIPDGKIYFRFGARDHRNNEAEYRLPTANNSTYIIDNFQPYVQNVIVLIDNINVYDAGWECNNNCPTFTGYECLPTQVNNSSIIKILVISSEKLIQLSGKIEELNGGFVNFTSTNSDGRHWQATFNNMGQLQDGDKGHMKFQGIDQNDNQILDMRAIVGGTLNANVCANIPLRAGINQWIPARIGGYTDDVHEFCFTECHQFVSNSNGCIRSQDITVKTHNETAPNRKDGWIKLTVVNNPDYWVTWKDANNNVIKNGYKLDFLGGLGSGKYCYEVVDDGCCLVKNCVILCPQINVSCVVQSWNPSSCDAMDGGFRVVNASSSGGTSPYSYHVEDLHGNIIPHDQTFFVVNNLKSGIYYIVSV
ncbi:MAG: hypothetical protein WBO44_05125, partial [Saprospiraceae bacterium]